MKTIKFGKTATPTSKSSSFLSKGQQQMKNEGDGP
jgi:hypothetical protein